VKIVDKKKRTIYLSSLGSARFVRCHGENETLVRMRHRSG
jgi:hypothetical protein